MKIGDRVEIRTNGVITQKLDGNQWEVEIKMKNGSLGVGVPESKIKVLAESPKPGEIWAMNDGTSKAFIRADGMVQWLDTRSPVVMSLDNPGNVNFTQHWHKVV